MINVPIQAIPNQAFSMRLNNSIYGFSIKETAGVMAITVIRDTVTIVENMRIVAGTFILPYKYEEDGNFYMFNLSEENIYYTNFGSSQALYYVTPQDLINLRSEN